MSADADGPTRTVADVLDDEQLEALADLNGLREARRALRDRGGETR
jgi:hypothetical protein